MIETLLHTPPSADRPLVASDMEGTLSAGVTWKGLRDYLIAHGRKAEFDRFYLPRLVQLPLYYLRLIPKQRFRENWIRGIFRLFAGMSQDQFGEVAHWVVAHELWPKRRQQIIDELVRHQTDGRRVVVISGLIEPMLSLFVDKIGVEAIGTPLKFEAGRFTGEVEGEFTTGMQKVDQLRPFLAADGCIAAAYGDTGADIPMLSLSRQPVAVAPDKKLRRAAVAHGWRIVED